MVHFLYKTICIENSKYYIGIHSTNNVYDGYLGSGTILKKAVNKYGIDKFERQIVKYFDTREELISAETEYLKTISENDLFCYNVLKGGKRNTYNHPEIGAIYKDKFERNSDIFYCITTNGKLYKQRVFEKDTLNRIYNLFTIASDKIAERLTWIINDKNYNELGLKVLNDIQQTADFPENLVITEMSWECAILA